MPRGGVRGFIFATALVCAALAVGVGGALAARTPKVTLSARHPYSVALEQCVGGSSVNARSATFAGEIHTIRHTSRMEIRINVQERVSSATRFRTLDGAAIGPWRSASPQVAKWRYERKVEGLTAPASYRGEVQFRWFAANGRIIRSAVAFTAVCHQSARVHGAMAP